MQIPEIRFLDIGGMLELDLWFKFSVKRTPNERDALIKFYIPLVKQLAAHVYSMRATSDVEYEDYYQYGLLGLIEAIDRYNASREAKFSTYARYRIVGSIYSGLTKSSEKRAQAQFRNKIMSERLNSLSELDSNNQLFDELLNVTIGLALGKVLEKTYDSEDIYYENLNVPYEFQEIRQLKKYIRNIVDQLPEIESLTIHYHYFHNVAFEEISRILGVSKGRVSQLHKNALKKIRHLISKHQKVEMII